MTIKVLVDQSALSHFQLAEGAARNVQISWGQVSQTVQVAGVRLKRKFLRDQFLYSEIQYLPTIAKLAKEQQIELFTYSELKFESLRGSSPVYILDIGNLLKNVDIEHLEPPVDRGYFQQMDLGQYVKDRTVKDFYKVLRELDVDRLSEKAPKFFSRLSESTQLGLKGLDRFRYLYDESGVKHCRDAFHLWTAEFHGVDAFLTFDKKFINHLTKTRRTELRTKPMLPSALTRSLGVTDLTPMPLLPRKIYCMDGVFEDIDAENNKN